MRRRRGRRRSAGLMAGGGVVLTAALALTGASAPAVGHTGTGPDASPASTTAEKAGPVRIPPACTVVPSAGTTGRSAPDPSAVSADVPDDPGPPEYYGFPLVSTGRVTGTARADGRGRIVFPSSSPFGVALAEDGSYRYDLVISADELPEPSGGRYVVWITTPSLDRIRRAGPLPSDGELRSRVSWNKFLVVVTLEPGAADAAADEGDRDAGPDDNGGDDGRAAAHDSDPSPEMWSGPIVLRGMSRSGLMHTMAGHGPFEQENCAQYGY